MGHNGMEQGHHAEMGHLEVSTRPTKHGILMVPKHRHSGETLTKRPSARRSYCAKTEAIPTLADLYPSRMILTFNCLKLV